MKPTLVHMLLRWGAVALLLAGTVLPGLAQYKVVQPDGSIGYTDRPPSSGNARVTPLGRSAARATPEIALPPELQQVVQRYPVTLYSAPECAPCDNGRRLLQQRGVPFSERRITSEEDAAALERLLGGRTVPALAIGPQPLRGFSETDWTAYLDAAGYPRVSKLPRGWEPVQATPLVERPPPARSVAAAPVPAEPRPAEPAVAPGGLRF
jgi:glutaredoxin